MFKLLLDAGHHTNHTNPGACAGYYESMAMWKEHLMLIEELDKYEDVQIKTTRSRLDQSMENMDRGAMAEGCDLAISLHSNGCDSEKVDRAVIIDSVRIPCTDLANEFGEAYESLFRKELGSTQHYQIYTRPHSSDPSWDYYGFLKGCTWKNVPGLILEQSFHSNRNYCQWAIQDENLRKMAQTIAKTLASHYHFILKQTKVTKYVYEPFDEYIIKKGDVYSNGKAVPSRLFGKTMIIDKVMDGAILLGEINSWIKVTTAKAEIEKYEPKQKYVIKETDVYTNGKKVPTRLVGQTMTIKSVSKEAILLAEINSWVKI